MPDVFAFPTYLKLKSLGQISKPELMEAQEDDAAIQAVKNGNGLRKMNLLLESFHLKKRDG